MSALLAILDKGVMPKGSTAVCISDLKCSSSLNCSGLFAQPATVIPSTEQALGSSFNSSVEYEFQDLSSFSLKVFHLSLTWDSKNLKIFENTMCGKTSSPPKTWWTKQVDIVVFTSGKKTFYTFAQKSFQESSNHLRALSCFQGGHQ